MKYFFVLLLCMAASISSYADSNPAQEKTFEYFFSNQEPFQISFADYPKGREKDYELQFKTGCSLPQEITGYKQGLKISGNNHSDDLFMYAYKKISGLKPNTLYQMEFSLEFASNASSNSTGVGGSPGDSVYVKIGAVSQKPERFVDDSNLYQIHLDKGNQGLDGKDMITIGTIGVETQGLYRLKTLPCFPDEDMKAKLNNYRVTTNSQGEAWIIFGTDSGYESTTIIFYTHLLASFKEANPMP